MSTTAALADPAILLAGDSISRAAGRYYETLTIPAISPSISLPPSHCLREMPTRLASRALTGRRHLTTLYGVLVGANVSQVADYPALRVLRFSTSTPFKQLPSLPPLSHHQRSYVRELTIYPIGNGPRALSTRPPKSMHPTHSPTHRLLFVNVRP